MTTKPHGKSGMIDLQSLQIRRMQTGDPNALASAFADMSKSRAQFERYWQENVDGKRVTPSLRCWMGGLLATRT